MSYRQMHNLEITMCMLCKPDATIKQESLANANVKRATAVHV